MTAKKASQGQNRIDAIERQRNELEERGLCTISDAARIVEKPRGYLYELIQKGQLSKTSDGFLHLDEVNEIAREVAEKKHEPGIDVLKDVVKSQQEQTKRIFEVHVNTFERLIDRQASMLNFQSEQLAAALEREARLLAERRESASVREEFDLMKVAEQRKADRMDDALKFLKATGEKIMNAKTGMAELRQLLEGMEPEQQMKLAEVLRPDQLAKLSNVLEAMQPGEAVESAAE